MTTDTLMTVNDKEHSNSKRRVKYYNLNTSTGEWNDCGTGYVGLSKEHENHLTIVNEMDDSVLLDLYVNMDLQFNMQRSTIITWSNTMNNDDDKAISFQDIEGVKEVWQILCHIQGRDPYEIINALCFDNNDILLPDVSIETLPIIDSIISSTHHNSKGNNNSNSNNNNESNAVRIKQINSEVISNSYEFLYKLGLLFNEEEKKAEELRSNCSNKTSSSDSAYPNNDNLTYISSIIKHLLLIAEKELLFLLCTDKYYEFVFGALEFDCVVLKAIRHRDYFKSIANFRNILDINDAELLMKIHLNHRLAYLRDTAAGRFIEETTFNNINLIIQANNSNIIRFFINNEKLITTILNKLNNSINDYQTQKDASAFLLELINCSQNSFQLRIQFLEILCSLEVIDIIESLITSLKANMNSQWFNIMNSNISQILINLLSFVPSQFKSHIISNINNNNNSNSTLLTAITQLLSEHNDFSIQYEIGEIIKTLLDNNLIHNSIYSGMQCQSNDSTSTIFFNMILNNCLLPLSELLTVDISTENRNQCITAKQITIEVLTYCITQHYKLALNWFIQNDILLKVLSVIKDKVKILDLQVVKFVNRLILNNDNSLNEEVIKTNALSAMIALFASNIKAKNIIVSAILNLIQTIKSITSSVSLKKFINNLFMNNKDMLYNKAYNSYFKELIDIYESSIEPNEETMSYVGLFPLKNDKNDKDDFDVEKDKGKLLGKKTYRDM